MKLKTIKLKHQDFSIVLETDYPKGQCMEAALNAIFLEFTKAKPDRAKDFMRMFIQMYNRVVREEEIKAAKKAGLPLPVREETEPDTFEFWKALMETPPIPLQVG